MMAFGICGMIGEVIVLQMRGCLDAFDWMEFCMWAVIAICGAIRKVK